MAYDFRPFGHLTTPNAVLYRRVMGVFVDAKRRFAVHLRPEDVREALAAGGEDPIDVADLTELLNKLSTDEWGNLRADPDTGRVTTVEDFHRARFLYQLTKRGEAAEEALQAYDDALGRRGALQAVALVDIATQLRSLHALAREGEPDPAKVHLLLRGLTDRFTDLADNAQAFMSSLQRSIDLHDADAEAFVAYKDRLIDYLERFVKDLVATGSEIATLVERIEQSGVDRLVAGAARRDRGRRARRGTRCRRRRPTAGLRPCKRAVAAAMAGVPAVVRQRATSSEPGEVAPCPGPGGDPPAAAGGSHAQRAADGPVRPFCRLPRARPLVRPGA